MKALNEKLEKIISIAAWSEGSGELVEELGKDCAEIVKEYAINFANWKIKNRWTYFIADGTYYNNDNDRTVANKDELFELFLVETEGN